MKTTKQNKATPEQWLKAVERYNRGDHVTDIAADLNLSVPRVYQFMRKLYKKGVLVGIDRPRRKRTSFTEVVDILKYGPVNKKKKD